MAKASKKLDRQELKDRTLGCVLGVFIGDCRGLPVECMSPSMILGRFGYVDTFVTNQFHPFKGVAKHPKGTKSDDSQLTLALMDSLARQCGYNLDDIKTAHIEAWKGKWGPPVGWGGSTRTAVQRMIDRLACSTVEEGAGNGPLIKIAGLACYCVYKTLSTPHGRFTNSFNHSLLKKCREIALLTHGDLGCIVGAYCQARMIIRALQGELPRFSKKIASTFVEDAYYAQSRLGLPSSTTPNLAHRLEGLFKTQVKLSISGFPTNQDATESIFDLSTGTVSRMICTERSSWIYHSYPLTAYCAAKYLPYKNFTFAINETVNAGADADSNASMVGAIAGADLGFKQIPGQMIKGMRDWRMLLRQARLFEQSL